MLNSGRLRHRVRIERLTDLLDSHGDALQDPATGQVYREWRLVANVWAAIEPVSAREFVQSQAMQSQVSTRIVIRWRDDVDASMRLVHKRFGRSYVIYNIHGVLADKDSGMEYLTLPCSQGTGDGR